MGDTWRTGREEGRSIVTLVSDGSCSLAPIVAHSPRIEEAYPVDFNAAFWADDRWTVHLGETLSLPQMRAVTQSRRVQCAHLFSDAVIFLAADLSSASDMYLEWLACCLTLDENRPYKPAARIVIQKASSSVRDFLRGCAARAQAGTLSSERLRTSFFDKIRLEQVGHFAWNSYSLPRMNVEFIAWEHVHDSHRSSRRLRSNHGSLWTLSEFRRLATAWEASCCMPDDVTLLTEPWPSGRCPLPEVLASMSGDTLRSSSRDFDVILTQRAALVSSYLMRHSFRSRHWTVPGESSLSNMFAESQFRLRYLAVAEQIANNFFTEFRQSESAVPEKLISPGDVVKRIKNCWLEKTGAAYRTCASVLESAQFHIKHLRQHRKYLARLRYDNNCAACLLEPWTHILPCKHGLCTLCLRACHGQEIGGCRMVVYECPICELDIGPRCVRRFTPPTATLRVLTLDGGGVKGLVQLRILENLLSKIGLCEAVHISTFFDLMVGSSIGGICALGLGTGKWSLEECRNKFIKFTEQIFVPKSRCAKLLSRFTGGWSDILFNTAKLIFFDSIYHSEPIDTVFKSSFGDSSLMVQSDLEHATKVAVIVNQVSTSGPVVFANYNKSRHRKNGAYKWPAMDSLYRSLKIWEVARATSAAPGFWNPVTLFGSVYQDGGLSHNNPSAVATNEANLLVPLQETDSLIVSVGCGRLLTAPLSKMSVFRRYIKVFEETLDAERQHAIVRMLSAQSSESLVRLNPRLDMEEVSLDEQSSISSLDHAVQMVLNSDSVSARMFSAECEAVARRLVASLFYFELGYKFKRGKKQGQVLQTGVVKTRLTENEFEAFRERYPEIRFRIRDLEVGMSISMEVEIVNPNSHESFEIELVHPCWVQQISGSPFTIAKLQEAQSDYLPISLCNGRKRKRA